jgi:hypothetical protein
MFYFYPSTKEPGPRSTINIWNLNGTRQYLKHYDQYMFLHFVTKNDLTTQSEKAQARKELTIAEQKLEFWTKHPKYDPIEAKKGAEKLKKDWTSGVRKI